MSFTLSVRANVRVIVLDSGSVVRTLLDGARPAGPIAVTWDGTQDSGAPFPDGRYRLLQSYRAYLNHLATVHDRLVQRYRDLNRRMRRGEAPAYFRKPAARPRFIEPPMLPPLPGLEEDSRKEVINRIDYYIKAVNQRLEETMPEYQTVGQLGAMERASA
jgi:hypothetical protein